MPKLPEAKRAAFLPALQTALSEFAVNTPRREAAFLAQIAHESGELTIFAENLNYSAKGLMATWPKRFPDLATAQKYERNPEKLANYVYANRIGNGDEASGDGWRFRGRGPIQITGRENYQKYGSRLNLDLVNHPDQAATPEVGFRIAGLYWRENGLNELADREMFEAITKRINGGLKGLEDRLKYFTRAKQALGVPATRGLRLPESELDLELPPEFTRGREALEEETPVERERTPRPRGAALAPAVVVTKSTARREVGPQKAARKKVVEKKAGKEKAAHKKVVKKASSKIRGSAKAASGRKSVTGRK
ncbi:MAG: glycoside hydrolase family 19 protein [candidate division KSB1 bacterium]|nr:glycoside hydrolase family 19 protein [candidate division KSB1 bacterium]MDZ7288261.1 glycoside hydrolase family 19 protein [candidate division KSB1 bacterium]MDZ7300477.1 glycoside hydrolase family 19 protein [candidate division KSB1 bacterium]MDZ7306826.1 glycoside hydrolase family 19 protein [candidate division KSB1 bacterium]MDZ7351476.1 glycoside hydrolase family 19 protein [candidate division KSB1 bacterium]